MITVNWNSLINTLDLHIDLYDNEVYPLTSKKKFLEFNRLAYCHHILETDEDSYNENIQLTKQNYSDLEGFWKHAQEKMSKDGTVFVLIKQNNKYALSVAYKNGIKSVDIINGEVIDEDSINNKINNLRQMFDEINKE